MRIRRTSGLSAFLAWTLFIVPSVGAGQAGPDRSEEPGGRFENAAEEGEEAGVGTGSGAETVDGDGAGTGNWREEERGGAGARAAVESLAPATPPPSPWDEGAPADEAPEPDPAGEADAGESVRRPGEAPSIPRRELPDYDHREPPPTSLEEALAWVPRILFFPVHVVFEYVLRLPIGWFITTAEREQWHVLFVDFFTWNERKAGLVPTAFFDFGFQPSVGLYFWWNDFLVDGNDFRAQIGFGGIDWLRATITDRVRLTEETDIGLTVDAWRRPDQVFQGLGYDSRQDQRTRYRLNTVEGRLHFRFRPWRASEIRFTSALRANDFEDDGYAMLSDDLSLGEAVREQAWYAAPPGFDGYTAFTQRLDVAIDSRPPRPHPSHGIRIEGFAEQGFDTGRVIDRRWLRYGASLGAFLDVGSNRVLGLRGLVHFADPLGSAPVPFLEQVRFGEDAQTMWGFVPGQLVGRSAAVATLEYRYPIWVFLDGTFHVAVGNVFDEHLSNFDVERLRVSFGLGLRSIGDRDQSFNVMLAFGSAPFDQGASVDSVRIVIGSRQGF